MNNRKILVWTLVALASTSWQVAGAEENAQRDRIHIAVQEICPVSGETLGEHGQPVKVRIGEEVAFLCCQGCLKGKVNPQHWATIHTNYVRAQRICPVMKHQLPANPKWTIVQGQIIYVCCPPCTKKVAADPETYLRAVDELYAASLEAGKTARAGEAPQRK